MPAAPKLQLYSDPPERCAAVTVTSVSPRLGPELGLIAAIPALLLHAYLSRKAKGITDRMEQSALSLVNGVAIGQPDAPDAGTDPGATDVSPGGESAPTAAESARDALVELLGPLLEERRGSGDSKPTSDPA